CQQGYNIPFTF
nr:immunoglobulin light chain junction region [Macaca mulatta]MOX24890.1 immunoglobulin light chain junction region [Macaca mulatta]MOX25041.1 immunoglobulin light chain junction region [Macaca mulatta]MOX25131.1 immunoglobulin light chain junction region [Macaca mulatta]MOX25749.1 immunoglobulin light chain junction region [Macaca mulatta]